MENINLNDCMLVLEAYQGKSKELRKCEEILDKICDEIINNDNALKGLSYANSTELKEVEKLLKKVFKAKKMTIHIYDDMYSNSMVGNNAFTVPQALASFRPTENGTSVDLNIYVSVSQGIISEMGLTGGETLAIILHEIGHNVRHDWMRNLVDIIYTGISPINALYTELEIPQTVMISGPKALDSLTSNIEFVKSISKVIRKIKTFMNHILKFSMLSGFLQRILSGKSKMLIDPISYSFGYVEEKYADSLATNYGYGYEMATASAKMIKLRNALHCKPSPISIVEDFITRSAALIINSVDCHPHDAVRVNSQIKNMKKHLKDPSITPDQRKELETSLELMEKFIEEVYLNPKSKENMSAPFTFIWNYLTHKLNGYVDLRELFNIFNLEA